MAVRVRADRTHPLPSPRWAGWPASIPPRRPQRVDRRRAVMAKTGSIRERVLADGSSAWVLVWRVGGRQVKRTVRGSQRDAERVLTAALAARDRGEMRAVSTETFQVYAERWLEAKRPRLEPSTYRDYETHLRLRLVPSFGRLKLRAVTRDRIERYLAELDARGSRRATARASACCRARRSTTASSRCGRSSAVRFAKGSSPATPPLAPTATTRSSSPTNAPRCSHSTAKRAARGGMGDYL